MKVDSCTRVNVIFISGMDKMIETGKGEVTITNDGATILKQMSVIHPAAKMVKLLVKLLGNLQNMFCYFMVIYQSCCYGKLIEDIRHFSWLNYQKPRISKLVMELQR